MRACPSRTFLILHVNELRFMQEEAFALVMAVASGAADEVGGRHMVSQAARVVTGQPGRFEIAKS